MKKLKLKRWKSDFSKKRKLLIALILITMTSLGVGYAALVTDLSIKGHIRMKEYNAPTLYNVLRNEALSGGLAKEYTGNHNDSIDPSLSTEKIYHYYANGNSDESKILGMNNVLFAGFCWRMYRTTDTGGVRLIYTGKAVDNKCESKGYVDYITSVEKDSLNGTYWYGTEIEYDANQNKYYLSGDVAQYSPWSAETAEDLVGKYTCKMTENDGCTPYVYYVATYFDDSNALLYRIYANNQNSIGYVPFTYDRSTLGDGGYMYGEPIQIKDLGDSERTEKLSITNKTMIDYEGINGNYWVADSFSYNSSTKKYTLVNPYQMSTVSDNSELIGKYTLSDTSSTASATYAYYIIDIHEKPSNYPPIETISAVLTDGMDGVNIKPVIGDSITDNGDGTYTINNASPIDYNDWYENYHNYLNAYMCDNATACTNPKVIILDGRYRYTICDATEEIMLGKDYEDGQLQNTITLKVSDYIINYDDYLDYKYTCSNKTDTCSNTEVRVITSLNYNNEGYSYDALFFLGDGVTWDGEEYTLTNIKPNSLPDTNRFTCPEKGAKKCTTAAYIIDRYGSKSYLELNDGDTTLDEVLNRALTKNIHDSETKIAIDEWYRKNMLDYSDYLEDTVFCNNRSIASYGSWHPPGYIEELRFFTYYNSDDLSCANITDRFAVGNEQAKLKYKVAIPSYQEMNILGYAGGGYFDSFRVMSPLYPQGGRIYMRTSGGNVTSNWYNYNVYPTISIKKDVQYTAGNGSLATPYYIQEAHTITADSNLFNYPENSIEGWKVYLKSDEYIATSFKLNGELIEGESFTMPNEDVTITDIEYIVANYTITNTDNTVTVPSTGRYKTTITLDAGNSYGVSSFKLNGTVVEGNSFTMPAENVTITDVVKFEQITVESEHNPYPNSLNNVIYYENTFEDAMALKVELTYQTQYYDDCIYIYDSPNGSAIGGGRYSSYKKTDIININGNYVKIIFKTNAEDNDYYGFMAKITPIYPHNITNTNSLFNVENSALTGTTLNITSDDYIVTSFKLNGELIEGESFTMPNEDVTITDITYIPANYTITNTDNTVTVPSTGRYKTTITLETSNDYRVTSFKMNGELITGNSFTMPAENVTITDITKMACIIVESQHNPYLNNENNTVYFERTFEGATSISVELTYQTEGVSWDWVYLYGSSNGSPINNKKYGGSTKTTETITVNSNYLKIIFNTDSTSNNYYGFKAIITPNYS